MRIVVILLAALTAAGCGGSTRESDSVSLQMKLAEDKPAGGLSEITMTAWGRTETFYLHDEVLIDNGDVEAASLTMWGDNPAVEVLFTREGGEKVARVTKENIGKRMAIIVGGRLVSAPVIRDEVSGGRAVINGDFTEEEAKRLAEGISP